MIEHAGMLSGAQLGRMVFHTRGVNEPLLDLGHPSASPALSPCFLIFFFAANHVESRPVRLFHRCALVAVPRLCVFLVQFCHQASRRARWHSVGMLWTMHTVGHRFRHVRLTLPLAAGCWQCQWLLAGFISTRMAGSVILLTSTRHRQVHNH